MSHERAHLARRDHWWKPLGFALLTVFWFHPLLWVAYILLCRDVELACDEKVIKDLSPEEKQSYSQILLECSMPRKWITACPLAFGETSVKQRIKAVLHYKKPTLWIIIAALVICSVLAVCFLTDPMDDQSQPWVATSEAISNKQYVYTKPGAGSAFYINIYSDGTFQYYAGTYSSHIGMGDWELKGSKLYLYDTTLTNPMTFVFSVTEDALTYIAAESYPFMYVQVADGDLFTLAGEIGKQKTNLLWVEVVEQGIDYIVGKDHEENRWRIRLTNDMIRRDWKDTYGGVWVKFYGTPEKLTDAFNIYYSVQYEVTAVSCWHHVADENLTSRENVRGWVYDYCLYDVDNDGNVEECIISMGHTSGLFTIHYSVWQDGKCEEEKLLYTKFAEGFAFDPDENGIAILSSEGERIYPGLTSSGLNGIVFMELAPAAETKSTDEITITGKNAKFVYSITYARPVLTLEVGLIAVDGTEYVTEIIGGGRTGSIENIPAGTYYLVVRNSGDYTNLPSYQNGAESYNATGVLNYSIE